MRLTDSGNPGRMGLVSKSLEYELTETETWYQTRYARAVLDNAMLEVRSTLVIGAIGA